MKKPAESANLFHSQIPQRRPIPPSAGYRPLHVVIIDDDPFDRRAFARMVTASRWPKTTAASFASIDAALDKRSAGLGPEFADVILLDDYLGQGIYAEQTIPRLLAAQTTCPIVVLTGAATQSRAIEVIRLGAAQFLEKDRFTESGLRTLLLLARSAQSTRLRQVRP